jgi:hypothetical protein
MVTEHDQGRNAEIACGTGLAHRGSGEEQDGKDAGADDPRGRDKNEVFHGHLPVMQASELNVALIR